MLIAYHSSPIIERRVGCSLSAILIPWLLPDNDPAISGPRQSLDEADGRRIMVRLEQKCNRISS